jgi:hypothetical protein
LIAKGMIQRVGEGLFRVPDDIDVEKLAREAAQS